MNKSTFFIVGQHAVIEALKNPKRKILRVFLTEESKKNIHRKSPKKNLLEDVKVYFKTKKELDKYSTKEKHYEAIATCPHLTSMMTITADGRLLVCAQDYNNDLFIGNLLDKDSTVKNLWERPEYVKFRKEALNKVNPPEICVKKCMIYNPGYPIN